MENITENFHSTFSLIKNPYIKSGFAGLQQVSPAVGLAKLLKINRINFVSEPQIESVMGLISECSKYVLNLSKEIEEIR